MRIEIRNIYIVRKTIPL